MLEQTDEYKITKSTASSAYISQLSKFMAAQIIGGPSHVSNTNSSVIGNFALGHNLKTFLPWSLTGYVGPDEVGNIYNGFVTYVMYQGRPTNPSSMTEWSKAI